MSYHNQTLIKAFEIIHTADRTLSPELSAISCFLVCDQTIDLFNDESLYLAFIERIIKERYNVSFPEDPSMYRRYVTDCLSLKQVLTAGTNSSGEFPRELWLDYVIKLLENLKTPYYDCYFNCLYCMAASFSDQKILEQTLSVFYSLMIKSTKEQLRLIKDLAAYFPKFRQIHSVKESLLSEVFLENLGLFCQDKYFWLSQIISSLYENVPDASLKIQRKVLLHDFMEKELCYTKAAYTGSASPSFQEYLAGRTCWMSSHKTNFPPELFIAGMRSGHLEDQSVDSEFLNTYAYNMNKTTYLTNPAIGRDQEISDLALILISPKKSPILLGQAGVGKTSVVEGLAYRLQKGEVPDLIKSKRIFKLTTTALLSGTKYVGEMEERMKQLTSELEKHPEVILFIDEIHTVVGAGSTESSHNDISNMLKPYIDRGDIKIIGATTTEEYDLFIAKDKALSRRFYPICISEPDKETTFRILLETIPSIEYQTAVKNTFSSEETSSILWELLEITDSSNQIEDLALYRPELPLTLLEMAFSYAAADSRTILTLDDLRMAVAHSNRLKKDIRMQSIHYFCR